MVPTYNDHYDATYGTLQLKIRQISYKLYVGVATLYVGMASDIPVVAFSFKRSQSRASNTLDVVFGHTDC